jgi:hypothetical protein
MSFVEALANVTFGYLIALATQVVIFPLLGLHLPLGTNLLIGAVFTIVSIVRSFVLRRMFEAIRIRGPQRNTAAR